MRTAPGLREVAETWWDVDRDPAVAYDDDRRRFMLIDPEDPGHELELARFATPVDDPDAVAAALAEGLAACDFPPTEDRASVPRVTATLRVAGIRDRPAT